MISGDFGPGLKRPISSQYRYERPVRIVRNRADPTHFVSFTTLLDIGPTIAAVKDHPVRLDLDWPTREALGV